MAIPTEICLQGLITCPLPRTSRGRPQIAPRVRPRLRAPSSAGTTSSHAQPGMLPGPTRGMRCGRSGERVSLSSFDDNGKALSPRRFARSARVSATDGWPGPPGYESGCTPGTPRSSDGDYTALVGVNQAARIVGAGPRGGADPASPQRETARRPRRVHVRPSARPPSAVATSRSPIELLRRESARTWRRSDAPPRRCPPAEHHKLRRRPTTGRRSSAAMRDVARVAEADWGRGRWTDADSGRGDVGKTRLAIEVRTSASADEWADGAWFIDLAPARTTGADRGGGGCRRRPAPQSATEAEAFGGRSSVLPS
jgi:hypothetical protein